MGRLQTGPAPADFRRRWGFCSGYATRMVGRRSCLITPGSSLGGLQGVHGFSDGEPRVTSLAMGLATDSADIPCKFANPGRFSEKRLRLDAIVSNCSRPGAGKVETQQCPD